MKYLNLSIYTLFLILLTSCEWPFDTKTTDDDIFQLSVEHNIERIMPTGEIYLSWNEITVEYFVKYIIEKRRPKDSTWTLVNELTNPFQLDYIDVISDDDDLTYRVGIVDIDNMIKWAEKDIVIPKTTAVIVPDEFVKIQDAVESELLDDGDEIFVKDGEYVEKINLHYKDVLIISESGFQGAIIKAEPSNAFSTINMSSGTINGFTIQDARAAQGSGGGLFLTRTGVIRNCLIINNFSAYAGGGIYMGHGASVYNSIFYANYATRGGSGIFVNTGSGEIINNTFIDNDIVITGDCKNLLFRNNIVHNANPAISPHVEPDTLNFTIDYSLFNYDIEIDSTNIIGDPAILDYQLFELAPTSICIDAGHPDDKYNDIDGSRNDIGSFGGTRARL